MKDNRRTRGVRETAQRRRPLRAPGATLTQSAWEPPPQLRSPPSPATSLHPPRHQRTACHLVRLRDVACVGPVKAVGAAADNVLELPRRGLVHNGREKVAVVLAKDACCRPWGGVPRWQTSHPQGGELATSAICPAATAAPSDRPPPPPAPTRSGRSVALLLCARPRPAAGHLVVTGGYVHPPPPPISRPRPSWRRQAGKTKEKRHTRKKNVPLGRKHTVDTPPTPFAARTAASASAFVDV